MKEHIGSCSKVAGFNKSILPTFSRKESEQVKGTLDYLGVNTYTAYLTKSSSIINNTCSWQDALGAETYQPDTWKSTAASWCKVSRKTYYL